MYCGFLIFCIVSFVGWIAAFDLDKTELAVNVKGTEITVTVPDDHSLLSVFFSTELRDVCTLGYTFVHNFRNSSSLNYRQDIKKELKNDDDIRILGVFQTKDQLISKTYDFKIDGQGNGIKQKIFENDQLECECISSQTEVHRDAQKCSGVRIFSEDFNASLSKWNHEIRSRVIGNVLHQELVAYMKNKDNCYLDSGNLYLNATWNKDTFFKLRKDCTSKEIEKGSRISECGGYRDSANSPVPPVFTAKLHTKDSFSFKYGRVEIRARFPIGDWLFPYLILQPTDSNSEDKFVNHLRIAYARGNRNLHNKKTEEIGGETVFGSAVVWTKLEDSAEVKFTEHLNPYPNFPGDHFGNDFHNYTMIWRKDRIIFKVDGFTYNTITDEVILEEFNKHECFIVLGLTVGGAVNFPDDEILRSQKFFENASPKVVYDFREKIDPSTWTQPNMAIDHVHVYTIHENEK